MDERPAVAGIHVVGGGDVRARDASEIGARRRMLRRLGPRARAECLAERPEGRERAINAFAHRPVDLLLIVGTDQRPARDSDTFEIAEALVDVARDFPHLLSLAGAPAAEALGVSGVGPGVVAAAIRDRLLALEPERVVVGVGAGGSNLLVGAVLGTLEAGYLPEVVEQRGRGLQIDVPVDVTAWLLSQRCYRVLAAVDREAARAWDCLAAAQSRDWQRLEAALRSLDPGRLRERVIELAGPAFSVAVPGMPPRGGSGSPGEPPPAPGYHRRAVEASMLARLGRGEGGSRPLPVPHLAGAAGVGAGGRRPRGVVRRRPLAGAVGRRRPGAVHGPPRGGVPAARVGQPNPRAPGAPRPGGRQAGGAGGGPRRRPALSAEGREFLSALEREAEPGWQAFRYAAETLILVAMGANRGLYAERAAQRVSAMSHGLRRALSDLGGGRRHLRVLAKRGVDGPGQCAGDFPGRRLRGRRDRSRGTVGARRGARRARAGADRRS